MDWKRGTAARPRQTLRPFRRRSREILDDLSSKHLAGLGKLFCHPTHRRNSVGGCARVAITFRRRNATNRACENWTAGKDRSSTFFHRSLLSSPGSAWVDFLTNLAPADFFGALLRTVLRTALRTTLRTGARDFFVLNPLCQDSRGILKVGFLQPTKVSATGQAETKWKFWIAPIIRPELSIVGQCEGLLHKFPTRRTHY